MKKYEYLVPYGIKIPEKYLQTGVRAGKRLIVTNKAIKGFEKYFVREIEVSENEAKKKRKYPHKYSKKELESMKYKELQRIAKKMGLPYKGKKVEIIERILAA